MFHKLCSLYGSISLPLYSICYTNPKLSMVPSALFYQSVASALFSPRLYQSSSILFVTPILNCLWFNQPSSTKVLHQFHFLFGSISPLQPKCCISFVISTTPSVLLYPICYTNPNLSMVPSALFYPSVASVLLSL